MYMRKYEKIQNYCVQIIIVYTIIEGVQTKLFKLGI